MDFDRWAESIAMQMRRKRHGFDPGNPDQSSVIWGLVLTEIVEAAQEWKRNHLRRPTVIAGELADALIRIGHFAATVNVRFSDDRRFHATGFNDIGDQQRQDTPVDPTEFWRGLDDLLWLTHSVASLHKYWRNYAQSEMPSSQERIEFARGVRHCVVEICVVARRLCMDLDAAVEERTAYNETRPDGWNIAAKD